MLLKKLLVAVPCMFLICGTSSADQSAEKETKKLKVLKEQNSANQSSGKEKKKSKEEKKANVLNGKNNEVHNVKDTKIQFKISGSVTAYGVISNPHIEYYDGEGKIDGINKKLASTEKIRADQDGLNLFAGYSYVNFDAINRLSNSWNGGGSLSIELVPKAIDMHHAYIFVKNANNCGIYIGHFKGPDAKFVFGGQSLCGGGFGIDGTLLANIDYATGALNNRSPIGFSNKATKIVFYSPSFHGFQIGFGYTPDTKHQGCFPRNRFHDDKSEGNNRIFYKGKDGKEVPNGKNNVSLGIKYENNCANGINTKLGLVFITESTQDIKTNVYTAPITEDSTPTIENIKLNNAKAVIASGLFNYGNFTLAAGYFNSFKSRLPQKSMYGTDNNVRLIPSFMVTKEGDAGHGYNIGVQYTLDTWAIAGVFNRNSRNITKDQKADSNVLTITVDKKINKNFNVFFEYDYVKSNSSDFACSMFNIGNNNAVKKASYNVFAIGATVYF